LVEICLEKKKKKESHVPCRGHLEYREYETKSGEKRPAAEIHLDEMQRLQLVVNGCSYTIGVGMCLNDDVYIWGIATAHATLHRDIVVITSR